MYKHALNCCFIWFLIVKNSCIWRQEYYKYIGNSITRTGFPSSMCPQPGHCLDPHNWCSSSFASMSSELLTDPSWLLLFMTKTNKAPIFVVYGYCIIHQQTITTLSTPASRTRIKSHLLVLFLPIQSRIHALQLTCQEIYQKPFINHTVWYTVQILLEGKAISIRIPKPKKLKENQ